MLGLGPHRAPLAGRDERALSPLVGRERELALLDEVLEQVERGQGQAVGIVGEAGVGKSRLLYEFRQRLAGQRVTVLEGRCLSYGSAMPYLPLLDLLRSHCGITEADSPEHITEKVRIGLQDVALEPEEYAPYLLHLLGVPAGTEPLALLTPEAVKARTFATLRQMSLNGSQRQPLILVVEDLHWIDKTSEEYLAALVESLAGAPLLVLGTYRVGYHLPWLDKSYTTQLTLRRLSPQDSLAVVHATGQGASLPEALVHELLDKAEGNPFFLEELTRAVLERGELGADVPVPDTIQGVLMARIDRLPEGPRHLLQTAAVLGRTCPRRLLEALWEGPGDLEALVQALQRGELLYERHGEAEPLYVFKHALTQEVAYDSLLQEQRRTLHTRVVTAIEGLSHDRLAEQIDRLAHHARQGELWDKAVLYCRQAGTRAMTHSAYREAVTYFEQALDALHRLPAGPDTQAQAIDLRLDLRSALWPLGEIERISVDLQDAAALAEALGDQHRLGWVSAYLLTHFMQAGEPDRALASGQRALAIAADLGEVGLMVTAQYYLGNVYRSLGDYRRAVECYRKNVACLHGELLQERFGLPGLASVVSRGFLAFSLAECGAFAEGRARAEEGVRIAEAADHPYSRVLAYWAVGFRALRQGDLHQALPVLERALDLAQGAHIRLLVPRVAAPWGRPMHSPDGPPTPCRCWSRPSSRPWRCVSCSTMRSGWSGWARRICSLAVWTRRTPRHSAPWSSPGPTRNGATKPTPCGSLATLRRSASPQRPNRLKPTTARPSPWPRSWACAHSRPTATAASALYIGRWDAGSRPTPPWRRPSRCTATMEMTFWLPQTEAALAQVGVSSAPQAG